MALYVTVVILGVIGVEANSGNGLTFFNNLSALKDKQAENDRLKLINDRKSLRIKKKRSLINKISRIDKLIKSRKLQHISLKHLLILSERLMTKQKLKGNGMNVKFVNHWLRFLAYMESGGDPTFKRYPLIAHYAIEMESRIREGKADNNKMPLSTAFSPWGITQQAYLDVASNEGDIIKELLTTREGIEIVELLNNRLHEGIPTGVALTATFYHRYAMVMRKEMLDVEISLKYFLHAYSCYNNPQKDILTPSQKQRVHMWFQDETIASSDNYSFVKE